MAMASDRIALSRGAATSDYEKGMVYRFRQNIHDAKVTDFLSMHEYGPFKPRREDNVPHIANSAQIRNAQVKALVSFPVCYKSGYE